MTLKQALSRARQALAANNVEDVSLESELLLRHTLKVDRAQMYLDIEREINPEQYERFWSLVQRRLSSEPSAYITGSREFFGLEFYVDAGVLIPRPETELLVEKAIGLARERSYSSIVDVGTGCGAIAVNLALNLPQAVIYAVDISAPALEVALYNCRKNDVDDRISLLKGNMLEPLPGPVDLIVANLPYVREAELAGVNTRDFEPSLALNGGKDGLEKVRLLCGQAAGKLNPEGAVLLEIGRGQGEDVTGYLRQQFPSAVIDITPDLAGIARVVSLFLHRGTDISS